MRVSMERLTPSHALPERGERSLEKLLPRRGCDLLLSPGLPGTSSADDLRSHGYDVTVGTDWGLTRRGGFRVTENFNNKCNKDRKNSDNSRESQYDFKVRQFHQRVTLFFLLKETLALSYCSDSGISSDPIRTEV